MTRVEILRALERDRTNLLAVLVDIPEQVMVTQPVVGDWTVKDLLGHIAMWQQVGVQFVAGYRADGVPKSLGFDDDAAVDAHNQREAAARRDWPLARVRVELDFAQRALISAVESLTDEDLGKPLPPPWPSGTTLEYLIAINSYTHDPDHVEQIKKWRSAQSGATHQG
jgi:hypothetical protein